MQRDTALTFGDIHGSAEALLARVQEIEEIALVKYPLRRVPLRIRLLEIPVDQTAEGIVNLKLTELAKPRPDQRWVSVSYCWTHSESSHGRSIPDYQITAPPRAGESEWRTRKPACPLMVFHRAVQFAQAHDCRYIWIDQECINQDDPTDIENHLQIMHRVYSTSRYTIAILSCKIPNRPLLDALIAFLTSRAEEKSNQTFFAESAQRVLRYITDDRWFHRAWTYQERHCADCLEFLIPFDTSLTVPSSASLAVVGSDLCVSNTDFWRSIGVFGAGINFDIHSHATSGGLITDHRWHRYSTFFEVIGWGGRGLGKNIFDFLEACDISILADKLAIYGNIYNLEFRFRTTRLRESDQSYSTCLLALYFASAWPDREERMEAYRVEGEELLGMTIGDFLPQEWGMLPKAR